jgi:hypothetical protein
MAIRYGGEAEIRIAYTGKVYQVRFKTDNGFKGGGTLTPSECKLSQKESKTSPEAYDKVAHRVLAFLRLKGVQVGEVRRVFQAPCPISVKQ